MVYVDNLFKMESKRRSAFIAGKRHNHEWCHLFADTVEELLKFAIAIGLKEEWLQDGNGKLPHFDIVPTFRMKALLNGAREIPLKEFIKKHLLERKKMDLKPEQENLPEQYYRVLEYLYQNDQFNLIEDMNFIASCMRQLKARVNGGEWYSEKQKTGGGYNG